MTIGSIDASSNIQSIYTYGNTHYNQLQDVPVTPVKSVNAMPALSGQEDKTKTAVIYSSDLAGGQTQSLYSTKQTESIKDEYADAAQVSYDLDNPYEAARMATEGTVLSGLNLDVYA